MTPHIRPLTIAVAAAAAASLLGGCQPPQHMMSKAASAAGNLPQPAATTGSSVTSGAGGTLRQVATPGRVVDDMKLRPGQCHERVIDAVNGIVLPDPVCSPGAIDPTVTQANIDQTICTVGYTATVRPSTAATNPVKAASLKAYSITGSPAKIATIELDHIVSLELGGASTTSNLFPELNKDDAKSVVNPKDSVERYLHALVCQHKVPLAAAQQAIATDWPAAVNNLGYQVTKVGGRTRLCATNGSGCVASDFTGRK